MWALAQERMGEAGKSRQTLHSRNLSISMVIELSSNFCFFDAEPAGKVSPPFPQVAHDDEAAEESLGLWSLPDIFEQFLWRKLKF